MLETRHAQKTCSRNYEFDAYSATNSTVKTEGGTGHECMVAEIEWDSIDSGVDFLR
jgi:hypothetical protein